MLNIAELYELKTVFFAVESGQIRLRSACVQHEFMLNAHYLSLFEKESAYRGAALQNCLP